MVQLTTLHESSILTHSISENDSCMWLRILFFYTFLGENVIWQDLQRQLNCCIKGITITLSEQPCYRSIGSHDCTDYRSKISKRVYLQNFKTDCTDLKSKKCKPVYLQTETTNEKGDIIGPNKYEMSTNC
jgi:hypothetical protein